MDWLYVAREAARAFNYTLGEWEREHPLTKAHVIAHYCEKNVRELYSFEQAKKAGDKGGGPEAPASAIPDWSRFRQGGGK